MGKADKTCTYCSGTGDARMRPASKDRIPGEPPARCIACNGTGQRS